MVSNQQVSTGSSDSRCDRLKFNCFDNCQIIFNGLITAGWDSSDAHEHRSSRQWVHKRALGGRLSCSDHCSGDNFLGEAKLFDRNLSDCLKTSEILNEVFPNYTKPHSSISRNWKSFHNFERRRSNNRDPLDNLSQNCFKTLENVRRS